jgi:hypothetical protein
MAANAWKISTFENNNYLVQVFSVFLAHVKQNTCLHCICNGKHKFTMFTVCILFSTIMYNMLSNRQWNFKVSIQTIFMCCHIKWMEISLEREASNSKMYIINRGVDRRISDDPIRTTIQHLRFTNRTTNLLLSRHP